MDKAQKACLRWRCRRGTKEMDIMLTRFFDANIDQLSASRLELFIQLLDQQDPQLIHWILEGDQPQDKGMSEIVQLVRKANNL